MKVVYLKKKWFWCALILFCLIVYALINIVGYIFNCKYISAMTAINQADDYQVRSQLLMNAMNEVGACDPKDAAEIWASGFEK